MSAFVTGAAVMATGAILGATDGRCVEDCYGDTDQSEFQPAIYNGYLFTCRGQLGQYTYCSAWWPQNGGMIADTGLSDVLVNWYDDAIYPVAGCNGRLSFAGVTRDQYGSAVGGCTVRCFRASTCELVSTVTSAPDGSYIATTPYYENHFLTVHKSGPPDIAGSSIDTVLPA